ncbi:MAG TPA: ribokinase [Phenylobacterium sp.]|nr:ribokinase [Phenylobacterium sp.]
MSDADIVVIGSYNTDVILSVAHLPAAGETCLGLGRDEAAGGKGSNQAVQAARCGARTCFVGAIGEDASGAKALEMWARAGIDADHVARLAGRPTGMAVILVAADGENCIVVDSGANAHLSPAHTRAAASAIQGARVVLAQLETPPAATRDAFEIARAHGVLTALNAAPAPEQVDEDLLGLTDLLFVNEGEAAALTGLTEVEAAVQALLQRVRLGVVVTLGGAGAILFRRDAPPLRQPAIAVDVVDTTGAGDAFIGAFVARLAANGRLDEAMRWGITAGALACTALGATPSYADGEEIARRLALP